MLLENEPGFLVVGEAAHAREAVELISREHPAIVLLDLDLGTESALDVISELTSGGTGVRVLILTGLRDRDLHRRAIRLGAAGVVLKEQAADLLIRAIRRVVAGEVWIDRGTTAVILDEMRKGATAGVVDPHAGRIASLTAREREIISLVAQGHGTSQLAEMLTISEKTVRNHLVSIYDKLEVSERLELALYAVKHGLASAFTRDN
jgi:DNA-binding NarL/FixJ family response regulator